MKTEHFVNASYLSWKMTNIKNTFLDVKLYRIKLDPD